MAVLPNYAYTRLHGEAEARNTQTRMNKTADERRALFPDETMDVKPEDTIVRFDDGVAMSVEMEKRYIDKKTDRVIELKIKDDAKPLPEPKTTFASFKSDFPEVDKNGNVEFDYNGHKVSFNLRGVFTHFESNTHHQNRTDFSGAFSDAMRDPLAVVKQPHRKRVVVYSPFETNDGVLHLAGLAFNDGGFTFYDLPIGKVKEIIKTPDGNVVYFKHSGKSVGTQMSVLRDTKGAAHTFASSNRKKPVGGHNDTGKTAYSTGTDTIAQNPLKSNKNLFLALPAAGYSHVEAREKKSRTPRLFPENLPPRKPNTTRSFR